MGEDPLPKWTKGMIVWAACVVPLADFIAWFSGGVRFREIVVCDLAFVLVIALFYLKKRDRLSRLSLKQAVVILLCIFGIPMAVLVCMVLYFATGRSTMEKEKETRTGSAKESALPLYAGWASADITPERPVNLVGQLHKRIARSARDPLTATALALETRGEAGDGEQAILVSCDACMIRKPIQERLRAMVGPDLPDFDVGKLFLNATHTHTAPGFIDGAFKGLYDVSKDEGVMKASEYAEFFLPRVAEAVVAAWRNRRRGGMSWALGHAAVGWNRRAHYFDGSSRMYGNANQEDFSNIEGGEDHAVEMMFFWEGKGKLTGVVINAACPSQETEGISEISADYWHDVRRELRKRHSSGLFILPQCGAAGDVSPHLLFRQRAQEIMDERRGLTRRQEIARRIADAVDEALPCAQKGIRTELVFKHAQANVDLPEKDPPAPPFYETDPVNPIEFHVMRLGEVALATNPFELYTDYGVRIKARSPAVLTFVVQLACQHSGYLPTASAVPGGGNSADQYVVGPEGGRILVDETVRRIQALWD